MKSRISLNMENWGQCRDPANIQGHVCVFKFSWAVGEFVQKQWMSGCRETGEGCVQENRWVNHYEDNTQAFCCWWSEPREGESKHCAERYVITMAGCLDLAPRSWTLSRCSPHKQVQQTITTQKRPWVCHWGCEQYSIRSFQTPGPLDAWVTNRSRRAGTRKAHDRGVELPVLLRFRRTHGGWVTVRL